MWAPRYGVPWQRSHLKSSSSACRTACGPMLQPPRCISLAFKPTSNRNCHTLPRNVARGDGQSPWWLTPCTVSAFHTYHEDYTGGRPLLWQACIMSDTICRRPSRWPSCWRGLMRSQRQRQARKNVVAGWPAWRSSSMWASWSEAA